MCKVFLYEAIDGLPASFLVNLLCSKLDKYGPLFQKIPTKSFKNLVDFEKSPQDSDLMLIPHTFFSVRNKQYVNNAKKFAETHSLKTIIFAYGDTHKEIFFENAVILRTAKYKETLTSQEIVIPAFVEDLGCKYNHEPISKDPVPVVGFSGMVFMPSKIMELKYRIKILLSFSLEIFKVRRKHERQGLYFRRRVMNVLSKTKKCIFLTKKRRSYSAAQSTIEGDPGLIREEFVENIKQSHLPLVVRGNGNYSLRFFEVLSLGRVPLFIDTNTPLPLEDEIDYDSFMLRVDHKDIDKLPEIIDDFWKNTTNEQFIEMQKKAREVFETKLRADVFYKNFFEKIASNKI